MSPCVCVCTQPVLCVCVCVCACVCVCVKGHRPLAQPAVRTHVCFSLKDTPPRSSLAGQKPTRCSAIGAEQWRAVVTVARILLLGPRPRPEGWNTLCIKDAAADSSPLLPSSSPLLLPSPPPSPPPLSRSLFLVLMSAGLKPTSSSHVPCSTF